MVRFGHDPEDSNEHGTASDAQRAQEHPRGEDVAQDEAREEGVPQQRDGAERGEDDDGQRRNLEDGPKEVRRYEDACSKDTARGASATIFMRTRPRSRRPLGAASQRALTESQQPQPTPVAQTRQHTQHATHEHRALTGGASPPSARPRAAPGSAHGSSAGW